ALFQARMLREALEGAFERHEIAGSIRRRRAHVGDIDHVLIPKFVQMPDAAVPPPADLFGPAAAPPTQTPNAIRLRIEGWIASGAMRAALAIKSDGRSRFGPRYIALSFNGHAHELWMSEPQRWGCTLLVRTGSAVFAKRFVTRLHRF